MQVAVSQAERQPDTLGPPGFTPLALANFSETMPEGEGIRDPKWAYRDSRVIRD